MVWTKNKLFSDIILEHWMNNDDFLFTKHKKPSIVGRRGTVPKRTIAFQRRTDSTRMALPFESIPWLLDVSWL